MRTKSNKDLKKIPPESDHKICLSVPKVVLDASDCAKLLEGTRKTSVIVMERDGKMVAVSSQSASSMSESSPSSSTSSSIKSSTLTTRNSFSESVPAKPTKESNVSLKYSKVSSTLQSLSSSSPPSASSLLPSAQSSSPNNGKTEIPEHKETTQASALSNHAQDSIPLDQGKMILKPPKKRRVNDAGLYEDSKPLPSSLVNGDCGHGGIATVPSISAPFIQEANEAVALRSTLSCPVISAPSNSLQKHTIENLLQSSSSNNNNNSSNNMNLISGLPCPLQTYTPIIHPPIHQSAGPDLCSTTTIPPLTASVLPAPLSSSSLSPSALLSSHQSSAFLSSSHTITTSSVLLNPSHESSPTPDSDPSIVYNNHGHNHPHPHHPHTMLQLPSVPPHVPVPLRQDKDPADDFIPPSSIASQPSQKTSASQPPYRTSPEQNEPINLSTTFSKVSGSSNELKQFSDNTMITDGHSTSELGEHCVQDVSCVNNNVCLQQQNIDVSNAELQNFNEFYAKNITDTNRVKVAMEVDTNSKQEEVSSPISTPLRVYDHSTDTLRSNTVDCSSLPTVVASEVANNEEKDRVSNLNQNQEESSKTEIREEDPGMKSSSPSLSSKDVSPPPEESAHPKKSKKSSKKKVEIPMDEESCAMRSSSYSESIDHVIQHFEYIEKPVDDDIELTEEEEAILRQQFDDSDNRGDKPAAQDKNNLMPSSQHSECDTGNVTGQDKLLSQSTPEINSVKVKSKGSSKKESKPKKQRLEKLSPLMQNVVDVLSLVAANVNDETFPSEMGLLDLEVLLKSLRSKCHKRISHLGGENDCSDESVADEKVKIVLKKARKTLSDISLFYPSGEDLIATDECRQLESSISSDTKDKPQLNDLDSDKLQTKPKKSAKRKSDSQNLPIGSEGEINGFDSRSTSDYRNDTTKPKKVKKNGKAASKSKTENKITKLIQSPTCLNTDSGSVIGQSNGECPSQATSDIGESIASTSAGSDEQMTPVHDPDTKDEGVNTDLDGDTQDTEDTEYRSNKPVRHYKKRLDFVKCSQCDHQCRGRSALSRHMKKVHLVEADMPYRCHLCTYGCTKMASLNRHLYTHNVFPCSRCDFRTSERDKLMDHMAERHKDKLDMKLCKKCSRYIKCDGFTIEDHTNNCQGPTPFKCTECSKEFKYASSLRVHHHTHFPDEPKLFKCELCDYRTNYKANLHKHHKNMHAVRDRQFQCPDCGKMFSSQDNMRRHRKVHSLVRQFSCETCKKSFKTSSSLKGHQLIHTATRPFTCNIPGCNRSFRTAKFLKSHQEEFHRLVPKKFSCQVEGCNYSFFKRSHLKRHAITHTGERNYHCAWPGCRKSFRHADNLKVHFRAHSMETIQCPLCDFKCKHRMSLFKHKKNVHKVFDASVVVSPNKRADTSADNKKTGSDGKDAASNTVEDGGSEDVKQSTQDKSCGTSNGLNESSTPYKSNTTDKMARVSNKSPAGSMDLYEFKSDGESEEEGPSPLRWDSVKSAATTTPLPPPPKELLLKNEKLEKKERDKLVKAEKKELMKKERADKKEQEKKEKAEKKNLEKKEKLEKKELEKKEKEEKREQEKRDKKEQKEKEKKEKEEIKEKEKKEKVEQKERERKEKEEQKEKEKKEKEEKKEQEKLKKKEEKEKEKTEKLAQKVKAKKEKERRKKEVKRLKAEAKRVLQKRSARFGRGMTRKASLLALKSAKGKKAVLGKRRSPSRAASPRSLDEKKPVKGQKKLKASVVNEDVKSKVTDSKKKKGRARNKSPVNEDKGKPPSRSSSPRAASPRGAGNKSPARDSKTTTAKGGKKKAASIPRRKPSARIKASQKVQQKTKKGPAVSKKLVKNVAKKLTKGGKRGRPVKKKVDEGGDVEGGDEEEEKEPVNDEGDGIKDEGEVDEKVEEIAGKVDVVLNEVKEESSVVKKTRKQLSQEMIKAPLSPSPSSSEEDMLQGKGSPYRDFSDAEDLDKEQEEEEVVDKVQPDSSETCHSEDKDQTQNESPKIIAEIEEDVSFITGKEDEDNTLDNDQTENYPGEESSDDEGINDIPLTPPRAPAPPPMESSEDELEPPETMDSPAPYSTPAPNTPYSNPAPNTPYSNPAPNTPYSNPAPNTPYSNPAPNTPYSNPAPNTPYSNPAPNTPYSNPAPNTPYSNPAPNTPFSVPGPTTPFSVPPPTNLVQQHSVHSEEMTTGVSSVASLDLPSAGSVEMQQPQGSVESSHPIASVEMHRNSSDINHHNNSVEMLHHRNSTEMPQHGSVEMHPHSVEMHAQGSVEMHPHRNSTEMHAQGSVEMHPHRNSTEMHAQGSVEMHPHRNSTEMQHSHPPVDIPAHELINLHTAPPSDMHGHPNMDNIHTHHEPGSSMIHSHGSQSHHASEDIHSVPQSLPSQLPSTPTHPLDKYSMSTSAIEEGLGNTSEADKRYFDQYLKNLSAANNQAAAAAAAARTGDLIGSPESTRDMAKSPSNPLQSSVATSVITSMDSTVPTLYHGQADLRRLEAMVGERQHPDPLYARDTMSSALSRQNTTNHATPTPTFEAFPSLNPLHSSTAVAARDNASSYLRQQENLFATPPVTSSFMAEAMFQRQSMTTPFLPPHPPQTPDRASLSRIPDPSGSLRTNNTSSLLRRPSTMPTTADMFAAPTMPQAVPRHPLTNAWSGQEVRPTHWQNPYFPRQTNMASAAAANNPFFPAKENYLPGRELMFDPSTVRSQTERGMFSSQDPLQLDRFDLSNFFPSAVTPYGSSSSSLDYPRPSHTATPKPFDDRYRQTAAAAATAGLPDFRGLPTPTSATTDRFPGIGVNAGFNLYPSNHTMPYHPQHVTDNMNSAFLTHPSTAQHAMLERDYAAAAAHRGLYPHHHHQNTAYPFIDERQYTGSSKLGHTHNTPTTVSQERDLMGRTATQESQMQDPYRSMLYRY